MRKRRRWRVSSRCRRSSRVARSRSIPPRQRGRRIGVDPAASQDIARRRVAAGMLIGEIARQNGIRPDSRRVAETLASIASTYEEPQQVVELYQRDPQLMTGLQNRVLEDQVAEWVAANAQTTEQQITFSEAMRPV